MVNKLDWLRNMVEVVKEVEEIEANTGKKIEPEIKDLVIGLRRWVQTQFSCEGHPDKLPYPWVDVSPEDEDKLVFLCSLYNTRQRPFPGMIFWAIQPMSKYLRLLPIAKDASLTQLQDSAVDFGKFLQKLRLPEPPTKETQILEPIASIEEAIGQRIPKRKALP